MIGKLSTANLPYLIGVSIPKLCTSQFPTRLAFLEKFMEEICWHNIYAQAKIPPSTCIANLNPAISEDEVLNSKVARIKAKECRCNNNNEPKSNFMTLYKYFWQAAIQLDKAKIHRSSLNIQAIP